jgi:hypothetical protein
MRFVSVRIPGSSRCILTSDRLSPFSRRHLVVAPEVDMQDNAATVMTLQALRDIGEQLRAVREELHRLNELLIKSTDSVPQTPFPKRLPKYPRMLPR